MIVCNQLFPDSFKMFLSSPKARASCLCYHFGVVPESSTHCSLKTHSFLIFRLSDAYITESFKYGITVLALSFIFCVLSGLPFLIFQMGIVLPTPQSCEQEMRIGVLFTQTHTRYKFRSSTITTIIMIIFAFNSK